MNISSVSSSSALDYVRKLSSGSTTSSSQVDGEASSDEVKLSKPAEMMKKLAALKESDPAKFKEVVSGIADKLSEAAQTASGEEQSRLSDLASKFSAAAESGDLSSLQPPGGGAGQGGHGGGPHGPRGAGGPPPPPAAATTTSTSDDDSTDDSSTASYSSASTSSSNMRAIAAYKMHERDGVDSALRSVMDSAMSTIDDALAGL